MGKDKKQKVRFLGQPNQTYNIGRKAFPYNVWIVPTPSELKHLSENDHVRKYFDFDPPLKEVKKKKKKGDK